VIRVAIASEKLQVATRPAPKSAISTTRAILAVARLDAAMPTRDSATQVASEPTSAISTDATSTPLSRIANTRNGPKVE
jgi:hypothetical protein